MESVAQASSQHPRLLAVCTGNLARSAMAQFLLAERLGRRPLVTSAGTQADEGLPMVDNAREALMEVGVTPGEFASRRLTADMIENADLVLTATRVHRADVLREVPTAMRKTFTLREFARLVQQCDLDTTPARAVNDLVTRAAAVRGQFRVAAGDYDIDDPIGRDLHAYRACRDHIIESVDAIAPVFARV